MKIFNLYYVCLGIFYLIYYVSYDDFTLNLIYFHLSPQTNKKFNVIVSEFIHLMILLHIFYCFLLKILSNKKIELKLEIDKLSYKYYMFCIYYLYSNCFIIWYMIV